MTPDMMSYYECERIVYVYIELTIPFEDTIEEAFARKKLKWNGTEVRDCGWQGNARPVDIGVRGFVAKSITLLFEFCFSRMVTQKSFKEVL